MVNQELVAGVSSYLLYGTESTYGTAGTVNKKFGVVTKFTPTGTRGVTARYGFSGSDGGGRESMKLIAGKYESSFSVDIEPQFWDWLQYVMGSKTGTGTGADPFIYTVSATTTSLTISNCLNNVTTDREELYFPIWSSGRSAPRPGHDYGGRNPRS